MSDTQSAPCGVGGSGFVRSLIDHPTIPDELRGDVARVLDDLGIANAYIDELEARLATLEAENKGFAARVAELEELVRQAEASNVNALTRLAAAEATIGSRHLENEAARRQLWRAENACDAMEKRLAKLEARCKRMEEAGDFMAYNENVDFETLVAAWQQAKEAKP